jgi:tetratricopeptide (TPR) repeat protein
LLGALALGFAAEPALQGRSTALAQDDWGVRRDPFDKGLISRYKRILSKKPNDAGALSKLMGMYRRYRSVGQLIREYESALKKKASFANLMVLGYLHQHEGKLDLARDFFARAVKHKPKNPHVHSMLGKLARDAGDPKVAEDHYRLALANTSAKRDKMLLLRSLADLALSANRIEDAKKFFETYIALDPKNLQIQLELGDALVKFKRYDEAIKIFKSAESKLRSDPVVRVEVVGRIGGALEGKGDDMAAIREYERGMKLAGRASYLVKELTVRTIEIHRRRGELPALISKFEKNWKAKRRGHFEWDTLARLYEESGLSDRAIEAYRKATKKAPYELDTQRRLIALLDNSGMESAALKQYEAVIRVAPGEPRFQLELAQRYWKLGNTKKAMAIARKIESRFSGDAGVVGSMADLYSGWEKPNEALAAYQKLTRIEPGDPRHLENLGEQYHQRGDKKKAISVWKKIIRNPSAETYARLARVYSEHDLLHEGLVMYDKAIRLEAKKAALYKGRANVYERLRNLPKAIADWETVLKLTPDKRSNALARREARRRVVGLLRRPSRHRRASLLITRTKAWTDAFKADPPSIGAGYYLVEVYNRQGEYQKAQDTLEKLRRLRPDDVSVMEDLVKVYRSNDRPDEAIELLLELAKKVPGRERDYYNQIAEIKTDLQQDGEAIEYARRALDKSPNDPVAYQRLAERYQAMQKQDEAISAYEKAIELAPRSFRVYFTLARLYINRGERGKAALLYREILSKASNQETLHKAGQEAVELEWLGGTLGELERRIAPLIVGPTTKPVYRRILVELYGRYVPDLAALQKSPDAKVRKAATKELARLGAHGLRPLLAALADEQDVQQQQLAVAVLGYLGNHGAAAPLVRLARTKTTTESKTLIPTIDMKVRIEALVAAGRLGDPRTIPDLIALSSHKEFTMREAAVFALGKTNDRRALPALNAATNDSQHSVQTLACLGMAGIKDASVSTRAIKIVKDESRHDRTRAACAWLLGYRRDKAARGALAQALAHGNDQTQRLAAWALGRLGDKSAASVLLEAYYTKREPVRGAAVQALAQVLSKRKSPAPPYIASFPMTSQRFDDARAIRDLTETTAPTTFDATLLIGQEKELSLALRSAITRYRDLVLRALAELDSREGSLALGELTASMSALRPGQRKQLEKTLLAVGRDLLPELGELTQHRDPEVRRRSLNVLAKIGGQQAVQHLHAALADTNMRVRKSAMQSAARLARTHDGEGAALAKAVAGRLQAKHWQERVAAATALSGWPKHGKTDLLLNSVVSDTKGFVRSAAARAISKGQTRGPAVVAALARAASHEHESLEPVRIEAVRALHALGGKAATAALQKVSSSDPSPRVRQLANDPK